jgi:hypothetical protein
MGSDFDSVRRHFLLLAEQTDKRIIDKPNDWRLYEVNNPEEEGETFNNETAWELIIRLLRSLHPIKEVTQKDPPGAVAYEMIFCLDDGWNVYIKLRAGKRGYICGRSFHYDERQL